MELTAKRKVENAFDNFRAKQQKHNDIHHMGNETTNDLARKKVFNNNPMQVVGKMPMVGTSTQLLEHQDENDETDIIGKDPIKLLNVLFEDRNVETVVSLSPGANLQAMANYIIDNSDKFQKKPIKRIYLLQDELEPAIVDEAAASKEKLKQSFFEDWKEYIGTHFKRPHNVIYDKKICNRLLHQHFLYCRTPFIEQIVQEFNGRFSTAAWFCFFVESNLGIMLRQYFLHLDQETWNIISHPNLHPRKRRINWIPNPEDGPFADSIREFYSSVRRFRADYDQLFQENIDRLMMHEKNNPPDMNFECSVCLGVFSISRAICCNLNPFAHILTTKNMHEQPMVPATSTTNNSSDNQFHRFCVECLIGHARAATQEMPLAMGGIGLQCMAPDCANPILFSECRFYIPPNVRRNLNARIVEENLGAANLENLERCHECNFAMIIEASPEEIRVFSCKKCQAKYCRKCQRQWDDSHIGRPCEEISRNEEQQQHVFENKLSEAIIRRCHRCSLPFVKSDGCNKMSCRCGATMCYICRTKNINYNHFCQHYRNPGQKNCKQCKKKCLLWQPEEEADRQAFEIIHNEAEKAGVNLNK